MPAPKARGPAVSAPTSDESVGDRSPGSVPGFHPDADAGPRPGDVGPVATTFHAAVGRVTCCFAGTGPQDRRVRWGTVPHPRSNLGPRSRARSPVPVIGPHLLGPRPRSRSPESVVCPSVRSRYHCCPWMKAPRRSALVAGGPLPVQVGRWRRRSGPSRMTRSVISARREATRSPRVVRSSAVGRLVVMRVGSMCSYRWLMSR